MKPFVAAAGALLALLALSPLAPAGAETTAACDGFPSNGAGAATFGFFSLAFDFPDGLACITWCSAPDAPEGFSGSYTRAIDQWTLQSTGVPGVVSLSAQGPDFSWSGLYRASDGSIVEGNGIDLALPMHSASGVPAVC